MFNYRCEKCKEGTVEAKLRKNFETKIQGFPFVVPEANIGVCNHCGAQYFSAQELARWSELYKHSRNETESLLSPEEITELRNKLRLPIGDFATLVGCTRQSVYNWERQDRNAPQLRIADLVLKLLRASQEQGSVDVLAFLVDEARRQGATIRMRAVARCRRVQSRREQRFLDSEVYSRLFEGAEECRSFPVLTDFSPVRETTVR